MIQSTVLAPLTTHHSSLITHHSSLITHHSSLITRYSSLVTRYSLLVTRYSLLVTRYSSNSFLPNFSRLLRLPPASSWWKAMHHNYPELTNSASRPLAGFLIQENIMSSHVFHEIFLHINWHTKNNSSTIIPRLEPSIHGYLQDRCRQTKGVYFHAIGGTENHVHLAIRIEPHVTISDLVGELKGACSHEINQQQRMKALEWQRGYGVVSFGMKQLPWVLEYIANQKEHHAAGRVFDRLERTEFDEGQEAG